MVGMVDSLKFKYDDEADAAYIYIVPPRADRKVALSRFVNIDLDRAAITVDFGEDGMIVGIEVLGASRTLPASILRAAEH